MPTQTPTAGPSTYGLGAGTSHGFGSHRHVRGSEWRDGVRDCWWQRRAMCGITLQQTNSDPDPVADLVDGDVGEELVLAVATQCITWVVGVNERQ